LLIGFGAFVVVLGYLVAASLIRPRLLEFAPVTRAPRAAPNGAVFDTVTIDARDANHWRFFDLSGGGLLSSPDTTRWDIAFRRFHVITAGAAADAGRIAFDSLRDAPGAGYVPTAFARDSVNPVLNHWYQYSFVSHVLRPLGHVYLVRTRSGGLAKVEFLSYYCPGSDPGCVTFRYAFRPRGVPTF
jgi:hypothetical protein